MQKNKKKYRGANYHYSAKQSLLLAYTESQKVHVLFEDLP